MQNMKTDYLENKNINTTSTEKTLLKISMKNYYLFAELWKKKKKNIKCGQGKGYGKRYILFPSQYVNMLILENNRNCA